jgi:hypothetical protein
MNGISSLTKVRACSTLAGFGEARLKAFMFGLQCKLGSEEPEAE